MSILLERITEYKKNTFDKLKPHYAGLASSQEPHTLLITCSDSRLCPQEFSQSQAGELFIVRNAGNLMPSYDAMAPSNEGLTLEYGISALNIGEIVVCGHTSCGAMGGVMNLESLGALPLVQKGLTDYKQANLSEVNACEGLDDLIAWNVRNQLESLMTYPFVKERLKDGRLKVEGLVYDFVNGDVVYRCSLNSQGEVVIED